jgi:two-component system sensor histidine kinase HydH
LDIESQSIGYDEVRKLGNEVEIMASKLKEQQVMIVKTERLSAIGELAARLAHDLRNPLSVMKNSLLLIRHKYGTNLESMNDFDRIDRSVSRMSHQLENVMDFVSIRKLSTSEKSLNGILKNAVEKSNIPDSIKVNLPSYDIVLNCDSEKIEIVFDNILVNAKQAMGDFGTINIRTSRDENLAKIEFSDSGPGIPEDVLPKIFEPLFTTKQEGTGLGLPSCKSIIELHGGNISVKTELGKGTTFTITLPIMTLQKPITTVRLQ